MPSDALARIFACPLAFDRPEHALVIATADAARESSREARPVPLRGAHAALAWGVCATPVLLGFVAPVLFMLRPLAADWSVLPWGHFVHWSANSLRLGLITAALAVAQWAAHRGTRVVWIGSPPSGLPLDAALPMRTRDDQRAALATLARHYRFDVVLDGGGVLVLRSSR